MLSRCGCDGTLCVDDSFCNGEESCQGGVCTDGPDPCVDPDHCDEEMDACVECISDGECDDADGCSIDACVAGTCAHDPAPDGTPCLDGSFCNGEESCQDGTCADGLDPCVDPDHCDEDGDVCLECAKNDECADGNPCTTDTCDAGTCVNTPVVDGLACLDDAFCNGEESCQGGVCSDGPDPCVDPDLCDETNDECLDCLVDGDCDDANPCTTDACEDNFCTHAVVGDGTPCLDGAFCNGDEVCVGGVCTDGADPCVDQAHCSEVDDVCLECVIDPECDDGMVCTTDSCIDDVCVNEPVPDGTPCPDDVFCDGIEQCESGVCADGGDPCIDLAHCDEEIDKCIECFEDDECSDGSVCTIDTCVDESCVFTPIPDGTPCDDGAFCNGDESCVSGVCADGPDPCIDEAHCDEDADECLECVLPIECEDGDACTIDLCIDNVCEFPDGTPPGTCCNSETGDLQPIDDFNGCTIDICNEDGSVDHIGESLGPIVEVLGLRSFSVTPQPPDSAEAVALFVTSPNFPCLVRYLDLDGQLVLNPIFLLPAQWGTIVVIEQDIVPSTNTTDTIYHVQADCGGPLTNPGVAVMPIWGDINDDKVVDFDDIALVLNAYAGNFDVPFAAVDLHPCSPDNVIDFDDVLMDLFAFEGRPFPCAAPCDAGACCLDPAPTCLTLTQSFCLAIDGEFMGPNVPCIPNPCQ